MHAKMVQYVVTAFIKSQMIYERITYVVHASAQVNIDLYLRVINVHSELMFETVYESVL